MTRVPDQEFKLFRIFLVANIATAAVSIPLQQYFIAPAQQPLMTWVYLWTIVYPAAMLWLTKPAGLRASALAFICIHLVTDTLSLLLHPTHNLAPALFLVFTFLMIYNIFLVFWPEMVITNVLILAAAVLFIFLPGTGFMLSLKELGLSAPFVTTAILFYLGLIAVLGTGMVEVKRRTESRLRDMNENLNQLVEQKVAEIQKADREVRQYQEQLDGILRHIPVGVVILDRDLRYLYTNGVHFKFELKRGMLRELPGGLMPLKNLETLIQPKAKSLLENHENLVGRQFDYQAPGGEKKIIRFSLAHVTLDSGGLENVRLVLITEDITRDEAIRHELAHADHLAALGKMAAGLAHEVNNPLAGIKLYLELLEQDLPTPERRKQIFDILKNGVNRIDRIVKSFLTFARQDESLKEWVDVREVLRSTLDLAANFKTYHRIQISTTFADPLPKVYADQHRLAQVFVNLLNNACDAMAENGGQLKIACESDGRDVVVRFADSGKGIKQEDLPNLFTPFFTTKERGQGTGLGLSTSYGIIQEHGGRIDVQSREGVGSVLSVRLPLAEPPTP